MMMMPWEVTASFGARTGRAPKAIQRASFQMDFDHPFFGDVRSQGIALDGSSYERWKAKSSELRGYAEELIGHWENQHRADETCDYPLELKEKLIHLEKENELIWSEVQQKADFYFSQGKKLALVGGDHSSPLGLYRAMKQESGPVGLLHIDAHCDLRVDYQGFKYSHASIFYRAVEEELFSGDNLFQIGIRDRSADEIAYAKAKNIRIYPWQEIRNKLFEGLSFEKWIDELLLELPLKLWISLDADGLSPGFCPATGTPVPGGFSYDHIEYLLERIAAHPKGFEVKGFDLCEVGIDERLQDEELENSWDAQVGARLLYALSSLTLRS